MRTPRGWTAVQFLVALTLLASYAYFWHSRDWNTASRLILTYALGDRGTLVLDGLDTQTGDIARFRGHYYCDKLPGFSFWAAIPYGLGRLLLGLKPHPLGVAAMPYWPADYWVTLGSSGLFTVSTALMLVRLARELGCSAGPAALVGLAYGLGTPAYVYATLAYGHQFSACVLLASFLLLRKPGPARGRLRTLAAGMLAALGPLVELQVAPVSAILGVYLMAQCIGGRRRPEALAFFSLGALLPTLVLLGYNVLAFGSPWEMGYFHHATAIFARVHNQQNPLGLRRPDPSLIGPLLWGQYRGLFFYAPILLLAPIGWLVLAARRQVALATVSLAVVVAVFVVNLSYPEWTGGWSTGPRLLVPLLPFAMIPVAGLLGVRWRGSGVMFATAAILAFAGGVMIFLFQGVGARVPQDVQAPFTGVVWPLWTGASAVPRWWTGDRFARNLASLFPGSGVERLPASWQWLQFLPLLAAQGLGIAAIAVVATRTRRDPGETPPTAGSDLGINQQQERRGADQDPQDPEAEPHRVVPDAGP